MFNRELIGNDCGVDTAELVKRLEKLNQGLAKKEAEQEANNKMESARIYYEDNKKTRTMKWKERKVGQPTLDDFEMLKVLGSGAFGKVVLVRNKRDDKPYALKTLKKRDILADDEIDITMTERNVLSLGTHCR